MLKRSMFNAILICAFNTHINGIFSYLTFKPERPKMDVVPVGQTKDSLMPPPNASGGIGMTLASAKNLAKMGTKMLSKVSFHSLIH